MSDVVSWAFVVVKHPISRWKALKTVSLFVYECVIVSTIDVDISLVSSPGLFISLAIPCPIRFRHRQEYFSCIVIVRCQLTSLADRGGGFILSGLLESSPSVIGNAMKIASAAIDSRGEGMTQQLHRYEMVEVGRSISRPRG